MRRTVRFLLVAALATALATPASAGAVSYHNVAAVSFGGPTGYIAGGYSPTGVGHGFVSRTTDGATWHATSMLNQGPLVGVKASSDGVRATIVRGIGFDWMGQTVESGLTWLFPLDPVPTYSVELNDAVYTADGRRIVVGKKQGNNYALIASSAGDGTVAEDWSGPVPVPSGDDEPPPTDAWFTAVDATPDGNTVWAVGNDRTRDTWDPLLRVSSNGGSTWTTPTILPLDAEVTDVVAFSATNAYVAQHNSYFSRTVDGGATAWFRDYIGSIAVNAIDAIDTNQVVVVGDAGKVYYSANAAGANPDWLAKITNTTNNLNGVVMLDADSWIVVGDNETILRTDNSGTTWTGSRVLGKPTVGITVPTAGFSVDTTTIGISGTSADPVNPPVSGRSGVGVAEVEVALQRANGQYWNGSTWAASEVWLDAAPTNLANGWDTWSAAVSIDATASVADGLVVKARSRDGLGQTSNVASVANFTQSATSTLLDKTSIAPGYGAPVWVSGTLKASGAGVPNRTVRIKRGTTVVRTDETDSAGRFSFPSFVPANTSTVYTVEYVPTDARLFGSSANVTIKPAAKLSTPSVSSYTKRAYRSFKTWAYLYPQHSSGAGGTTLYYYRYKRLSSGKYGYAYYKKVGAKAANSSAYPSGSSRALVSVKLPRGKWRVKAVHEDSGHTKTTSGYRYFRVY